MKEIDLELYYNVIQDKEFVKFLRRANEEERCDTNLISDLFDTEDKIHISQLSENEKNLLLQYLNDILDSISEIALQDINAKVNADLNGGNAILYFYKYSKKDDHVHLNIFERIESQTHIETFQKMYINVDKEFILQKSNLLILKSNMFKKLAIKYNIKLPNPELFGTLLIQTEYLDDPIQIEMYYDLFLSNLKTIY